MKRQLSCLWMPNPAHIYRILIIDWRHLHFPVKCIHKECKRIRIELPWIMLINMHGKKIEIIFVSKSCYYKIKSYLHPETKFYFLLYTGWHVLVSFLAIASEQILMNYVSKCSKINNFVYFCLLINEALVSMHFRHLLLLLF